MLSSIHRFRGYQAYKTVPKLKSTIIKGPSTYIHESCLGTIDDDDINNDDYTDMADTVDEKSSTKYLSTWL